jgi:putative membrane protein
MLSHLARTALALLLLSPAFASAAAQLTHRDRNFMETAARSGNAEIEIGNLAARKATLEEVRNLAARIVEDHSRLAGELRQLAALKGVRLPQGMPASQAVGLAKLRDLTGARFDVEYTRRMVNAHEKDVRVFRKQARSGTDPDVVGFASNALPVLNDHLARAKAAATAAKILALSLK